MNTHPGKARSRLSLLVLFALSCMNLTLYAQKVIPIEELVRIEEGDNWVKGDSGEKVFYVRESLILDKTSIPLETGADNMIYIPKLGATQFQLEFYNDALNYRRYNMLITGTGAFGGASLNPSINLNNNRRFVEIPLSGTGEGIIMIRIIGISGTDKDTEDFAGRQTTFKYHVVAFEDEMAALPRPGSNNVNQAILSRARLYEGFRHYLSGPQAEALQNTAEGKMVADGLSRIENELSGLNRSLATAADASYQNLLQYYHAFAPLNYAVSAPYRNNAIQKMREEENRRWRGLGDQDISGTESYLRDFCGEQLKGKYACQYMEEAQARIESFLTAWSSDREREDYCRFWEEIKTTDYYNAHPEEARFLEAAGKCDVVAVDPDINAICQEILSGANVGRSLDYLTGVKARVGEAGCPVSFMRRIDNVIEGKQCDELTRQMWNEVSSLEQQSLAEQILNGNCPEAYKTEAREVLALLEPLQVQISKGPDESREGGRFFHTYEIRINSGTQVRLIKVDEEVDSLGITRLPFLKAEKIGTDSLFQISVYDLRDTDHTLYFRSGNGKVEKIGLSLKKFALDTLVENEDWVFIKMVNSKPPFNAIFKQGEKEIKYLINQYQDTIYKSEISYGNEGNFALYLKDNFGSEIDTHRVITLSAPFEPDLWMFLALPFFLISGFLVYRNVGIA